MASSIRYDPNAPDDPGGFSDDPEARRRMLDQQLGGDDPQTMPQVEVGGFTGGQDARDIQTANLAAPAGNVRDSGSVTYGNGVTGTRGADGLWYYPWRAQGYQDVLGDNEVMGAGGQQAITQFRNQYGAGAAEDDASAMAQMNGQAPLKGGGMVGAAGAGQSGASTGGGASAFTQSLRDILMKQLGEAGKPVSVDDPGVREILAGQRLGLQRGAERQHAAAAERLAGNGLANSGAADTARSGIEQQRGEAEAQGTGQVLSQELGQRRQQLQGLLQMALANGDNESARQIQMQIAQMGNSLGQDQLAYNYSALNQNSNLAALNAILGLGA